MRIRTVVAGLTAIIGVVLAGTPATSQEAARGPAVEGIEVHGHWIIEVYDGEELVERREFQNAMVPGADTVLSSVLAGEQAVDDWIVDLDFQNFEGTGTSDVRLVTSGGFGSSQMSGLTITTPNSGDNAGSIVFEWSGTPWLDPLDTGEDGQLIAVYTDIFTTDVAARFTEKNLASPVTIAEGQTVNLTVIISFTG